MVASLLEIGIGRTVIENVPNDNTVSIRVYRNPNASVTHYATLRSKSRTGFDGEKGDDDSGFEEVSVDTQPVVTDVFQVISDATEPTDDESLYYRTIATDNATPASRTERGAQSNVVIWHQISNDRRVGVPTFPVTMRPNHGVLSGLAERFEDSDGADGPTWYEFKLAQAKAVDEIQDHIAAAAGERAIIRLFLDAPASLRSWFEQLALSYLFPSLSLPDAEQRERLAEAQDQATMFQGQMMNDQRLRSPGSSTTVSSANRILR